MNFPQAIKISRKESVYVHRYGTCTRTHIAANGVNIITERWIDGQYRQTPRQGNDILAKDWKVSTCTTCGNPLSILLSTYVDDNANPHCITCGKDNMKLIKGRQT